MPPRGKVNILYVITKLELGGAQKQLLELIRGLDKDRFNPFLITAAEGLLIDEAARIPGLTLIRCKPLERPVRPVEDLLALVFICRFIKHNKIDIVHTHSSKAGILGRAAARITGVKAILHTVHGWSFHDHQFFPAHLLYRFLETICAFWSDGIIVVSRHDRETALQKRIGTPGKYRIIRYALDSSEFPVRRAGYSLRRIYGIPPSTLVIGMIACFKPQKAPLDFIRLAAVAVKVFPGAKFVLVGDGEMRESLRSLIKKLGLERQVILTGWRRDIPEVISSFDVFVLTSLWEGLPIAVLEAIASFVPVVVSDTGGVRDIVKNGETGYLVKAGDITAFMEPLEKLLASGSLRKSIAASANASLDFNEYSPNRMVKETSSFYSDLLS